MDSQNTYRLQINIGENFHFIDVPSLPPYTVGQAFYFSIISDKGEKASSYQRY